MGYEAQGVYMRLLCHMWTDSKDQCSITSDPKELRAVLKLNPSKFNLVFAQIQWAGDPLLVERKGKYISKRLQRVKREQVTHRKQQSEAGKRGAEKRWRPHGDPIDSPMAKDGSSPSPSPSPSSSLPSKDRSLSIKKARAKAESHPSNRCRAALLRYLGFIENEPGVPGHRIEDLVNRAWGLRESMIGDNGLPADEIFDYAIEQTIKYKAFTPGYIGRVISDSIMRWRDGAKFAGGKRTDSKSSVRKGQG